MIRPHDFEEAKEHIQTFANNTSACTDLDKVSTSGGLFGLFDHNVTGAELNKVTGQVQDHLVRINELQKSFISEFGQVYKALESLDSEYIKGILIAVKGAQESSDQAKAASEKAQKAQTDISKTIEGQKKVIAILTDHKKKLETIKHLYNIDEIWKDLIDAKKVLDDITETVEKLQLLIEKEKQAIYEIISEKEKDICSVNEKIDELQQFSEKLKDQDHIVEIDLLWSKVERGFSEIEGLLKSMELITSQIEALQKEISSFETSMKPLLEQGHIQDIDKLWETSSHNSASISEMKSEICMHNSSIVSIQNRQDELLNELNERDKEKNSKIEELNKKLKIAYIMTGALATLEIVHLIVGFLL